MIEKLSYLLKHSSIYTIATVLQKLTGVVLLIFLTDTSLVTKEENSAYNFFITSTVIFTNLFSLGMESAIVRFLKLEKENRNKILITATHVILLSLSIAFIVVHFGNHFFAEYAIRDLRFQKMVIFIALVAAFDMLSNIPQFYFRANERPGIFTLIKILRFVLEITFIYIGLTRFNYGIMGAVYGLSIAATLNFIILLPFYKRFYRPSFDWVYSKKMLAFALPLVPNAIMYLLIEVEDRYFLDEFVSKEVQTAYTNMYKFAAVLTVINSAFRSAFQPIMLREAKNDNRDYFRQVFNYFMILASTVMIFTSLLAVDFVHYNPIPFIRNIIRDEFYYTQTHLLALILFGYVFLGAYYNFSVSYYFKGKSHIFLRFTVIALISNFLINLLMIPFPQHGTLIAASATAFSYFLMASLSYLKSRSLFLINYDFRKIFWILLYCIASLILAVFYPSTSFWLKVLMAFAYIPYLMLTKVLTMNEFRQLSHEIRS